MGFATRSTHPTTECSGAYHSLVAWMKRSGIQGLITYRLPFTDSVRQTKINYKQTNEQNIAMPAHFNDLKPKIE
jgi:hypothetical protein